MEYYLAIKRNKVINHATTYINFENVMLKQVRLKGHIRYERSRMGKSIEAKSILMASRGWSGGDWVGAGGETEMLSDC